MKVEKEQMHKQIFMSIAPMIDISNTHFRFFMRLLTKKAKVYTQMLHHEAVIRNHEHVLPYNKQQHPIVLQLGGCQPQKLAEAAAIGQRYGYDEINLNVGCPSPRVQKGSFGACLMKEPEIVRQCMKAIRERVKIPISVKCRLGVDEFDSYEFVNDFIKIVSGDDKKVVTQFTIHARKAFLKGLNPAQNRSIPPLQYQKVYQLKKDYPNIEFELNGGIKSIKRGLEEVLEHNLDGCMIGRCAYENSFELIKIDELFYGEESYQQRYKTKDDNEIRKIILLQYAEYVGKIERGQIKDELGHTIPKPNSSVLVKPILNMYNGMRNSAKYRQFLSDHSKLKNNSIEETIKLAIEVMENKVTGKQEEEQEEETTQPQITQKKQQQKNEV